MKYFDTHMHALQALSELLKKRQFDFNKKHIIITPPQYTLTIERFLFPIGAFDIEVMTFERLFEKFCEKSFLTRIRAICLIYSILQNKKLQYFEKSKKHIGLSEQLYDIITELKLQKETISDSDIEKELSEIFLLFEQNIKEGYVDAAGRMQSLIGKLQSENINYYMIGFENISPIMMDVINSLDSKIEVFLSSHKYNTQKNTKIYIAKDKIDEFKFIATTIRNLLYQGIEAKDIAICTQSFSIARRVLSQYQIPLNVNEKKKLKTNSFFIMIKNLLECNLTLNFLFLLRNENINIDNKVVILVEEFLKQNGIKFAPINFIKNYKFKNENISIIKKTAKEIEQLKKIFFNCDNKLSNGINNLLQYLRVQSKVEIERIVEIATSIDENFANYNYNKKIQLFIEFVNKIEYNDLPCFDNAITISNAEGLRCTHFKYIFVCDMNEGVLFGLEQTNNIFSKIRKKDYESIYNEKKNDLLECISNSDNVYLSYINSLQPAFFIEEIINGKNVEVLEEKTIFNNLFFDNDSFVDYISCYCHAKEFFIRNYDYITNKNKMYFSNIFYSLKPYFHFDNKIHNFISEQEFHNYSITQIEKFYSCPYMHYCQYILNLKKNSDFNIKNLDIGIMYHNIMEKFGKNNLENEESIIEEIIEKNKFLLQKQNKFLLNTIKQEAKNLCKQMKNRVQKSAFKPKFFEKEFNIQIDKNNFRGKIDRIDVFLDYFLIIDYKTGISKFSFSNIENGTSLQLPLYLYYLKNSGFGKPFGAFYYPLRDDWGKEELLTGFFLDNPFLIYKFDGEIDFDEDIKNYKTKNIKVTLIKDKNLANEFGYKIHGNSKHFCRNELEMDNIFATTLEKIKNAIQEIEKGNISSNPKEASICDYCDFSQLCSDRL